MKLINKMKPQIIFLYINSNKLKIIIIKKYERNCTCTRRTMW